MVSVIKLRLEMKMNCIDIARVNRYVQGLCFLGCARTMLCIHLKVEHNLPVFVLSSCCSVVKIGVSACTYGKGFI